MDQAWDDQCEELRQQIAALTEELEQTTSMMEDRLQAALATLEKVREYIDKQADAVPASRVAEGYWPEWITGLEDILDGETSSDPSGGSSS